MYEDCCYNRESQEGTERDTTILHSYSTFFLGHRGVDSVVFYLRLSLLVVYTAMKLILTTSYLRLSL